MYILIHFIAVSMIYKWIRIKQETVLSIFLINYIAKTKQIYYTNHLKQWVSPVINTHFIITLGPVLDSRSSYFSGIKGIKSNKWKHLLTLCWNLWLWCLHTFSLKKAVMQEVNHSNGKKIKSTCLSLHPREITANHSNTIRAQG